MDIFYSLANLLGHEELYKRKSKKKQDSSSVPSYGGKKLIQSRIDAEILSKIKNKNKKCFNSSSETDTLSLNAYTE